MSRRKVRPITRLALAMRVAALHIDDERFRKMAAREAEGIPIENAEIGGGRRGEMARMGRKTMARLTQIAPEDHADTAALLIGCADAVMSGFKEESVVTLGERRRYG